MALLATVTGAVSALGGLQLSMRQDTPAGPSVIVVAALMFAATALFGRRLKS